MYLSPLPASTSGELPARRDAHANEPSASRCAAPRRRDLINELLAAMFKQKYSRETSQAAVRLVWPGSHLPTSRAAGCTHFPLGVETLKDFGVNFARLWGRAARREER